MSVAPPVLESRRTSDQPAGGVIEAPAPILTARPATRTCPAAPPDGAGTLSELAFAWIYRRLVIAFRVPGWSGRLAGTRIDDRVRFPTIPDDQVFAVDEPEEAVAVLRARLAQYRDARRRDRA